MSAVHTAPLCPMYVPTRSPSSEYHSVGWWSLAHVNTKSPSRLYLMNVRGLSWPFSKMGRMVARA